MRTSTVLARVRTVPPGFPRSVCTTPWVSVDQSGYGRQCGTCGFVDATPEGMISPTPDGARILEVAYGNPRGLSERPRKPGGPVPKPLGISRFSP